jgi:acyl-CoA dehydrogenase
MYTFSERSLDYQARLRAFMDAHVYPNEGVWDEQKRTAQNPWAQIPIVEELKVRARAEGLWNMALPHCNLGPQLSNFEYAPLAEQMGHVHWSSEVFNCHPPETGNMEMLDKYGSESQKAQWLPRLADGSVGSAFSMTEPDVASSDATNIRTRIERDGDHYVINGRKWWTSGAGADHCKLLFVMGQTDPDNPVKHRRQSMIIVPKDTPGVTIVRDLNIFGYSDAPHGHAEILYENVRVPVENVLLGEGRGFEIAQGRLGPGRIHHTMRNIGMAERALEKMCRRALEREAFGKLLSEQGVTRERIAEARIRIEQARLLVLNAAHRIDTVGAQAARNEIAMIKVAAPLMLVQVVDWAIQLFGAAGATDDFGLGYAYARARIMRFVDGPDEVHRNTIARTELAKYREPNNH